MSVKDYDRTVESLWNKNRVLNSIIGRKRPEGIPINQVPTGTKIITGGGTEGIITGRQTRTTVQIKLESGENLGEYDWISKEAYVTKI